MPVRRTHPAIAPAALITAPARGTARASVREQKAVIKAIAKLPRADRALLAHHGLRVELIARSSLEDGMLGATSILRGADGRWTPTRIRVASKIEGRGPEALAEVVQHEIGHAISVIRAQDKSEDAAARYARRW